MSRQTGEFGFHMIGPIAKRIGRDEGGQCFQQNRLRPVQGLRKRARLIFPGVGAAFLLAYQVPMKAIETLLGATEEDVREPLKAASFGNWPQDDGDLLEFFILMIDTKLSGRVLPASESGLDDPDLNFRSADH
ncbi:MULTISPECIES: hypothetical protein [unclassified Novosphingobium]|uniref:hypothetical protein n=1 Tax=unclassified Novosphingobium TaxID=2644732 RepID=UPI001357D402|nr:MULTISPECIES: hypothetical protein [unclassified Novosphingobium]